jgi:hypothetical protein
MKRWTQLIAIGGLAVVTMGASCTEVTEPLELTIDVEDVTSTYAVPAGFTTFGSPGSCKTISASTYADTDYDITNARISDITVQTVGTFAGALTGGTVTVNGSQALTYSGAWNDFNTAQSLLTSSKLTTNPAGINALVEAIKNGNDVTICSTGTLSQPTTAGLQIVVNVKGQIDVTP